MGCDDVRCSGRALDEEEVAAYIRDAGTAAGVGYRIGDRHSKNADTSGIREQVARPVIHRRTERHGGSIGGKTDTPTREVITCFAVIIRATLRPEIRCGIVVVDADVATVGTGCAGVVVGCAYGERIAGGGETETVSALVATGDDFVGGVLGPGDAVVAGEVDVCAVASTINNRALILSGTADGDGIPTPSKLRPLRPKYTVIR